MNRVLNDLKKLEFLEFKKGNKDTRVKHIYLFETNNVWEEPLNATFRKYKDKITIVNKKFSNTDSSTSINGSKFLKDKGVNFL